MEQSSESGLYSKINNKPYVIQKNKGEEYSKLQRIDREVINIVHYIGYHFPIIYQYRSQTLLGQELIWVNTPH